MIGKFFEFVVCEAFGSPVRATEPFYTGAHQHPQKLDFISISKVGNPCFYIDLYDISTYKKHWCVLQCTFKETFKATVFFKGDIPCRLS
jgi:hypothetical protein